MKITHTLFNGGVAKKKLCTKAFDETLSSPETTSRLETVALLMGSSNCYKTFLGRIRAITPASVLTFALFSVFGLGSWLALNGTWAELPVLVASLPECYNLPTIITVVVQLANIGPITYAIVKLTSARFSVRQLTVEIGAVYTLVFLGIAACAALAFFWDKTAVVGGQEHAVALIALIFVLSLVDCTSTLVFIPFMKHFPAGYIAALFIGEGLSGVLPSVAALSQGFVNESIDCAGHYVGVKRLGLNFSPSIYFGYIGGLTMICGLAFTVIITLPLVRRQMITTSKRAFLKEGHITSPSSSYSSSSKYGDESQLSSEEVTESREDEIIDRDKDDYPLLNSTKESSVFTPADWDPDRSCSKEAYDYMKRLYSTAWNSLQLLVCMFVISFLHNGALSALSAYVFKPYGNTVYTVAVNLGILAGPFGSFAYLILSHNSRVVVAILTSIVSLLGIYLLVMAGLSPHPLLSDHITGKILIVVVHTVFHAVAGYTKVSLVTLLHRQVPDRDSALLLVGVAIQLGSFVGAILFFCLIYFTDLFVS